MPVSPGKKYKEYNALDFGDLPPISLDDFVNSMAALNGEQGFSLKDVMSAEDSLPMGSSGVSAPVATAQPVAPQEDILSKIKALEPEFTRKPVDRKPTSLMDVVGAISQSIGGGRETKDGGKDFMGGIMDVLDRIGGYASSGQGTSLLGAITGNREMIASGLNKLAEESQYAQKNQESNLDSARNALDYYKTVGSITGEGDKGQYLIPKTYWDESTGAYRLGFVNTRAPNPADAFIRTPNDVIVRPEDLYIGENNYTGETFSFGKGTGKTKTITPQEGAFTPNERKDLTDRTNSLISSQAKTLEILGSVRNARGLVNSTHGLVSLQNMLSTAAGDPGNKSVADREGITGPNAFLAKFKNYYSMSVDGKLPPEGQAYVQDLISKYEQAAINKINSEVEIHKQAFLSLYRNADPVEVDKHFRRIVADQISDITERNKKATINSNGKPPAKTPPTTSKPTNKQTGGAKPAQTTGQKSIPYISNKGKPYDLKDPRTK